MALPLFAVTVFVSAFVLFLVQPMVGKMILPKLGGTPQVWNTCMVFFQSALLAGYGSINRAARAAQVPTIGVAHGTVNGCVTEHGVPMAGAPPAVTTPSPVSPRSPASLTLPFSHTYAPRPTTTVKPGGGPAL